MELKRRWLGDLWYLPGAAGNDINKVCGKVSQSSISWLSRLDLKTNVPDIRLEHRHRALVGELAMIQAQNPTQLPGLCHSWVLPTSDAVAAQAMAKHT